MTRDEIAKEFDRFFEFDTDDRSTVTSTSARLFAEHIVRLLIVTKREPLTIETINKLWNDAVGWGDASSNEVEFVRAIERAHGIGGEK